MEKIMKNWTTLLQNNDYLGIKKLLGKGLDVNDTNESGESLLAAALRQRCSDEIIDLLLQNKADLYACNAEGVSILDYAIMYNKINLVKIIIDKGVNINVTQRPSKFTPLMGAVCYGRGEIAKLLLEQGADIQARDSKGLSALDFAKKTNKKSMISLLEETATKACKK
jgi:uncharacterized protein